MTPVMFAYGGWQTASFISGELKRPERDLAIGLLLGVIGVIVVYVLVNVVCVRVLGPSGLAQSEAPASDVMRATKARTGLVGGRDSRVPRCYLIDPGGSV